MARKSRKNASAAPTPKAREKWKAALYIRLSVEDRNGQGDSLETQRQIIEAYLMLHTDIEITDTYVDNGFTGQTFERPAFQRMLNDAEQGKINCVVVKDLSRLGRNAIDTGFYLEKYFPLRHIRFISVNDQYDSMDESNSSGYLTLPLKNLMNEAYAADISRKVRFQQRHAMLRGEFVGARPPYGYKKDPNNCHKLVVNEDTAPVVCQIFQWVADGVPINSVVKRLNEMDVPTPGRYLASVGLISSERLAGGGVWRFDRVVQILEDEVYVGDMIQGKSKSVAHKQIPTPPDEWIIVRNTHSPLVSRELFARVQAVRAETAMKVKAQNRKSYTKNILRDRVFCGCCGKPLHRSKSQQGHYQYNCVSNGRIRKGFCAARAYIRETDLFDVIMTIIRQKAKVVIGNGFLLRQYETKLAAEKAGSERKIAEISQKAEKIRLFQMELYCSYTSGVLTRSEYAGMQEEYRRKLRQMEGRVQQILERRRSLDCRLREYLTFADSLAAVDNDTVLSAALVDQLIERITVDRFNDVSIHFRFADLFEELMEVLDVLGDA